MGLMDSPQPDVKSLAECGDTAPRRAAGCPGSEEVTDQGPMAQPPRCRAAVRHLRSRYSAGP